MNYKYSPRDTANRAPLTINGRKVGRVHFRDFDAWLNPYKSTRLKSKPELEELGFEVEIDSSNRSFPINVYLGTSNEAEIARKLEKAFYGL